MARRTTAPREALAPTHGPARQPEGGARPSHTAAHETRRLQRAYGNRGVARLAAQAEASPPGRPLPAGVRTRMELAFGADFTGVRVQVGSEAAALGAAAATQGERLYVRPGEYAPDSFDGLALLGHELAHVIQQRAGRVSAGAGAINNDAGLEAEADRAGVRAARGEAAQMSGRATAGGQGVGAIQLKKRLRDKDIDPLGPNKQGAASGAINQVDLVTYQQPIGTGTRTGFFKPDRAGENIGVAAEKIGIDPNAPKLGHRAVATSRLGTMLRDQTGAGPGSTILTTRFAEHRGQKGVVAERAPGRPLKTGVDRKVTVSHQLDELQGSYGDPKKWGFAAYDWSGKLMYRKGDASRQLHASEKLVPTGAPEFEDPNAFYHIDEHDYYHRFDFTDPNVQRGLLDLQLMDAITGQVDRHSSNIFIDDYGNVRGIDDDASFGAAISDPRELTKEFDKVWESHNKGLPPLVDHQSAQMVLSLDEQQLRKELEDLLDKAEIEAAVRRLTLVKQHIQLLYAHGRVVGGGTVNGVANPAAWDRTTYDLAMMAGPDASYLAHAAQRYQEEAARGWQYAEGPALPLPLPPAPLIVPGQGPLPLPQNVPPPPSLVPPQNPPPQALNLPPPFVPPQNPPPPVPVQNLPPPPGALAQLPGLPPGLPPAMPQPQVAPPGPPQPGPLRGAGSGNYQRTKLPNESVQAWKKRKQQEVKQTWDWAVELEKAKKLAEK